MPGTGMLRGWAAVGAAVAILTGVTMVSVPPPAPEHVPAPTLGRPHETTAPAAPPPPPLAGSDTGRREAELQALLHQRSQALRARDEAAFLESVDPKAPAEFHERQRAFFRNLAGVPLAEWNYEVDFASTVPAPAVPEPADETWAPRIALSYALSGVDTVPTKRALGYSFVRRGDSWYLASDDALRTQGRTSWRGPWDFGPCRVASTEAGLVLGHHRNQNLMDRVARALDSSAAAVTEVWGQDWPRRVGILLPDSHAELQAMVGPEFAVDDIAAVAVADRVDTVARRVEGPRIVLNPRTAAKLSDEALRVVLRHEITHIAARAHTKDGAPMWMLEGFADYVGYRDSALRPQEIAPDFTRQVREQGVPASLPADGEFSVAGRRLDVAYQQSWSLLDFLVRRLGEQRVVELYQRIAGAGSSATVDTALRELAGMSTAELITAWSEELPHTLS